ncbi:MAG: 6-phosphogluconolactonase [Sulfitobacter sp.]
MNIEEYADRELLAMGVANIVAGEIRAALLANDTVSVAVPGGTTPGPIFDLLSAAHLDWDRVHVMLTDERWVPTDHAQSNAGLIRERLLVDNAAAARFIPFYQDGLDAIKGSAKAAKGLASELPLSVLMLGMGADMHTASLFPGADGLDAALADDAPLLCPIKPAGHDIARVTLPAHVLDGALAKHLVIFGAEKREALERAQSLPPEQAPIAAVLDGAQIHWAE